MTTDKRFCNYMYTSSCDNIDLIKFRFFICKNVSIDTAICITSSLLYFTLFGFELRRRAINHLQIFHEGCSTYSVQHQATEKRETCWIRKANCASKILNSKQIKENMHTNKRKTHLAPPVIVLNSSFVPQSIFSFLTRTVALSSK